ncbi:hypothetical protein TIFTF001_032507 [Ficus carica]|uniref:Bet v I/Major latex protein domain-containing protein n=1 Tax=Ficus carica TaxID=3494 RepID=A0AA88J6T4_FICCA|nr:hypothetical protein TIFTF001_032507 [Ficus carica]
MGVFTFESETTSPVPPSRLFKALVLDAHNLVPKIAPQAVKHAELVEGDGGPGSIKKITFGEGSEYKYMKHLVDALDTNSLVYNYTIIEGDVLGDGLEKISYETKIVASTDGGSVLKRSSKYHTKGDHKINEEHAKEANEKASVLIKVIEGYLLANPDTYN